MSVAAEDQGWMVDDGTCDPCAFGNCQWCDRPNEEADSEPIVLVCCCDEGYRVGYADGGDSVG